MPSPPLVDLEAYDLEQIQYDKDFIQTVNAQRFEMFQLSGVIQHVPEEGLIIGFRDVEADEWWARGHIPGRPIFPGVLMIETGAQLCTFDYMMRAEHRDFFFGFGGVDGVRFRGTIEPGQRLIFVAREKKRNTRLGKWQCQAFSAGRMVFEAEIMGVIV